MKAIIKIFALLISVFSAHQVCAQQPRISSAGVLRLGPAVQQALDAYDKDFLIFSVTDFAPSVREFFQPGELPMAVVADFNMDKTKDVVLMGKSRGKQLVLALISSPSGYRAMVVNQAEFTDPKTAQYGEEIGYSHHLSTFEARRGGRKVPTLQLESVLAMRGITALIWDGRKFSELKTD